MKITDDLIVKALAEAGKIKRGWWGVNHWVEVIRGKVKHTYFDYGDDKLKHEGILFEDLTADDWEVVE